MKFKLFEEIYGVHDLDYIDSFAEIFSIFSQMKKYNFIDDDGNLIVNIDDIGGEIPEFDDLFDVDDEYYSTLNVVREILNKYYKKI